MGAKVLNDVTIDVLAARVAELEAKMEGMMSHSHSVYSNNVCVALTGMPSLSWVGM